MKSSIPRDWRRTLGRWVARAFVYAAAATARREGHVETLSQSSKRPELFADEISSTSLACPGGNHLAASRQAYLGVERILMADRLNRARSENNRFPAGCAAADKALEARATSGSTVLTI